MTVYETSDVTIATEDSGRTLVYLLYPYLSNKSRTKSQYLHLALPLRLLSQRIAKQVREQWLAIMITWSASLNFIRKNLCKPLCNRLQEKPGLDGTFFGISELQLLRQLL